MHNIQAVLFDFDDTLQDREAAYRAYCAAFLGEFFPALPPEEKARRIDEMERILKAATASVRNTSGDDRAVGVGEPSAGGIALPPF